MKVKKLLKSVLPFFCLSTATALPITLISCSNGSGSVGSTSNLIYINSQNAGNLDKNLTSLLSSLTTEDAIDDKLFTQTLNLFDPFNDKIKSTQITLMNGANNKVAKVVITLIDECTIKYEKDTKITNFNVNNKTLTSIQSYQTGISNS